MKRMDLFVTVHKGLRTVLYDTARQVARADFGDPEQADLAVAAVRKLNGMLEEHAEHEDRVVLPELERFGPVVSAELHADHNRVGGLQREIDEIATRLERSSGEERLSLGQRMHEKLNRLVAEHLLHMEREETTASRILWAHLTDEQLLVLHGRILAGIPSERLIEFASVLAPAVNPAERNALLGGLQRRLSVEEMARLEKKLAEAPAGVADPATTAVVTS